MTDFKTIASIIATILTFIAFIPYIWSIVQNKTKPHVFSWIIWGISTLMVFFAQLADGGGAGAWPIGISGLITLFIAALAYTKKASITITWSDWCFFIAALSAMPFWYITSDPLWAVVILTSADTAGFLPTLRKAYFRPFEEQLFIFVVMSVRNIIAIIALEHYSLTTVLFPAAITFTCVIFVSVVLFRRGVLRGLG